MNQTNVRAVQERILEIMKFIDRICREYSITYFIMGGTALGAVRHGGFIPWDDDLDIFMTPSEYGKFKAAFNAQQSGLFVLQEWKTCPEYLEYAKVRMNGTTFIEKSQIHNKDLHQGIFVDIMILHKLPQIKRVQKRIYFESKYAVLYALTQRGWHPKNIKQKVAVMLLKLLPNKLLLEKSYRDIYSFDDLKEHYVWSYYLTKAKFKQGMFEKEAFDTPEEIQFEDTCLLCPHDIKRYLSIRYGDYMKLPSVEQRKMDVHAYIFDTEKDYKEYID